MLLPRARDGADVAEGYALGFHFVKEQVEGFGPHEGWRVDNFGVGMVEDAILRAVVR